VRAEAILNTSFSQSQTYKQVASASGPGVFRVTEPLAAWRAHD
jgi:cellobiose-specific phosphotransferase system component IIC